MAKKSYIPKGITRKIRFFKLKWGQKWPKNMQTLKEKDKVFEQKN